MKRILPILLLVIGAVCYFIWNADDEEKEGAYLDEDGTVDGGGSYGSGETDSGASVWNG